MPKNTPRYPGLAASRWETFTLVEQLANVGSEVERAIRAHEGHRHERWEQALDRALELFDLTAADKRWHGRRRREILRARELFCSLFFADDVAAGSAAYIRKYFMEFAVATRRRVVGA